jgi:hypothetical protein
MSPVLIENCPTGTDKMGQQADAPGVDEQEFATNAYATMIR